MKITRATTYVVGNPWKNWLFVRLDTDQPGLYGIGEGTLNAFARTIETAIHELAPRYEGMDPFQVETIYQRMTRDLYSEGGQIHMQRGRRDRRGLLGHHRQGDGPAGLRPARRSLSRGSACLRQRLVRRSAHARELRRARRRGHRSRVQSAQVRPVWRRPGER